ncbi:MAG: InlB B-repeat-containing protein, partial [Oscillospiraceae bacterium]|nr:InlB B-repeat-containing protein [Oscillospiraceae bacterium]
DPMASFNNCSVKGVRITAGDSMNLVAGFTSYGYGAKFNGCTVTDVVIKCVGRCYGATGFTSCAYVGTDCVDCTVSGVEIEAGSVNLASGFIGTVNRSYWNSFSDPFALFTSCSTENVSIKSSGSLEYTGGFCAVSNRRSTFTSCTADNVTISNSGANASEAGVTGVGGFIGQTQNGDVEMTNTFTDCKVTGLSMTIVGRGDVWTDSPTPGGFIGSIANGGKFVRCSASGKIDGTQLFDISGAKGEKKAYVGGFVGDLGWNNGTMSLENCTASVDITAKGVAGGFVGCSGLVISGNGNGNYPRYRFDIKATFTDCAANGAVVSLEDVAGGFVGEGYVGSYLRCVSNSEVNGPVASGFWGRVIVNPRQAYTDDVTVTDCVAAPLVYAKEKAAGFISEYVEPTDEAVTTVTIDGYTTPDYFMIKATGNTEIVDDFEANDNISASGKVNGGYAVIAPKENENEWIKKSTFIVRVSLDGGLLTETAAAEAEESENSAGSGSSAEREVDRGAAVLYVADGTLRTHILVEPVVSFNANGGTPVEEQHVPYGFTATSVTTERNGYIFSGWYLDGARYDFSAPVYESITLDAVWFELTTPEEPEEPEEPT